MDRLFCGWRTGHAPENASDGQPHASLGRVDGKSIFESIEQSGLPDEETYVLARSATAFAILNVYPYTSGHVMVLPLRALPTIADLTDEEYRELWEMVRHARQAVVDAFSPEGINIGINEGRAGGGSQPDHLHVHVVPRWAGDTNFMSSTADARILPMTLADTWQRLSAAWP